MGTDPIPGVDLGILKCTEKNVFSSGVRCTFYGDEKQTSVSVLVSPEEAEGIVVGQACSGYLKPFRKPI